MTTQGWEAVGEVADRLQRSGVLGIQRALPGLEGVLMRQKRFAAMAQGLEVVGEVAD